MLSGSVAACSDTAGMPICPTKRTLSSNIVLIMCSKILEILEMVPLSLMTLWPFLHLSRRRISNGKYERHPDVMIQDDGRLPLYALYYLKRAADVANLNILM